MICVLTNAPNHQELALQQLYAGIKQANADSVTVFLEKVRNISEYAYGLASTRTMNQTSTVIQKVVGGLRSKDLAQLTSSVVISLPFNFNNFRDIICQFELQLASECSVVSCFKCAGMHKTVMCKVPKNKLLKVSDGKPYHGGSSRFTW